MPKNRVVRAIDLRRTGSPTPANLSGTAAPVAGGGTTAHALSGPLHTGTLAQSQAPWALTVAALAAHAALPDVHHARAHSILSAADHSVSATAGQVLTAATGTTLGWATPAYDVSGGASALLRSQDGDLLLRYLSAVNVTASGQVRTPTLDTASGGMTVKPAAGLDLDPGNNTVRVMASAILRSENYASQTTGWGIGYNGAADFRYLFSDELHAKSFIADLEQALAGLQIITKSVALLALDFTVPGPTLTATIRLKDLPSAPNMSVFQNGDLIRLRTFSRAGGALTIADAWGVVTAYADQADGTQTYTFTRSAIPNHGAISTGTVIAAESIVLDYGAPGTGGGYYEVNAVDGTNGVNAPYAQVAVWNTHPVADLDVRVRVGNLKGITGNSEYGLWAGRLSGGNVIVTGDGVMLRQGTTEVIALHDDGTSRFENRMTLGPNGEIVQGTGTAGAVANWTGTWGTFTGLRMGRDSSVGRIGGYNGGTLQWYGATDGKFYFGGGGGVLDAGGLWLTASVDNPWESTSMIKFKSPEGAFRGGLEFRNALSVLHWRLAFENGTGVRAAQGSVGEDVWIEAGANTRLGISENSEGTIGDIALSATTVTVSHSAPTLNVGSDTVSTGAAAVQVGHGRTGSGYASIDLVGDTTNSDYGMRILRGNSGANAVSQILHRGTGNFAIQATEAAALLFQTAATTRMTIESTGNVDVVNELRAAVLRADLTTGGSGVAGTFTLTAEAYRSVSTGTLTLKTANGNNTTNTGYIKAYDGTTVIWIPYVTSITP